MGLAKLREDRLITQRALAKKAKVALRTIVNIETGGMSPRVETRRRLLRALGLPFKGHRTIFGALPMPGRKAK